MKKMVLGLALCAALVPSAPALAASVNLRVEGKTDELVPSTRVTLPAQAFAPDGQHPCAPDSIGGALQAGTNGDWVASYSSFGYFLKTVRGFTPSGSDYFALWVNHKYTNLSVCDSGLQEGDDVLVFVDYCDYDPAAQSCSNAPVLPLALALPPRVTPGTPFTVTVTRYDSQGNQAPVAGATVTGAGTATTDASGRATLTASGPGPLSLRATKPNFAGDTEQTCATTGGDGFCGTAAPGAPGPAPAFCDTNGADGLCGTADRTPAGVHVTGIAEQERFPRKRGPRTLRGMVEPDTSGLKSVALRLTRNDHGRCSRYSGRSERFVRTKRCSVKAGMWFGIGDRAKWSYLLPERLPRGRYVLDVHSTDGAGNVDRARRRGQNRVVFYVR